jgi:hypothetical protein
LLHLQEPERTLTLLAAGTGLRISECLGLQWQDVNFAEAMIQVRRTWTCGRVGLPKSKASKAPVPLHPLLGAFMLRWKQETTYSKPIDWVFPSVRMRGKQPRTASILVEDYLRPAAIKAGILSSYRNEEGKLVENDPRRSFLIITPPVRGLDIVGVVVAPCSAHSFRIPMVRHHVIVVSELFVADGADATLLSHLSVQQLSHFGR